MAKGTFGERLKREREMRGVSLEEIAAATRISTRFLEALEDEQWDRLPGGVFNRGFIRAISHFLGLDEESLVAEYAMVTDDHPEVAVWANRPGKAPRAIRPWVVWLVIVVFVVGGWLTYRRYQPRVGPWRNLPHVIPASARGTAPQPAAVKVAAPPAAATASTPNAQVPAPMPNSAATVTPQPASGSAVSETARPATSQTGPTLMELTVEAGKNTRVNVVADGKIVFSGPMAAGHNEKFHAKERFDVRAWDSSALLLELNGQTLPPLGPPDQPGSVTLTRKDLKKLQGGQD